jgi:hypothetical protein
MFEKKINQLGGDQIGFTIVLIALVVMCAMVSCIT